MIPFSPFRLLAYGGLVNTPASWTTPAGQLLSAPEGTAVNIQLQASHPVAAITYTVASGQLPPGVSLSSSGLLTGTLGPISQNTTYTFTVRATPVSGIALTRQFSIQSINVYTDTDVLAHFKFENNLNNLIPGGMTAQQTGSNLTYFSGIANGFVGGNYVSNETSFRGSLQIPHTSSWPTQSTGLTVEFFVGTLPGVANPPTTSIARDESYHMNKGQVIFRAVRQSTSRGSSFVGFAESPQTVGGLPGRSGLAHVAFVREAGTSQARMFVNGMSDNNTFTWNDSTSPFEFTNSAPFRIDELRISRIARYRRTFNRPSAPLPLPATIPADNWTSIPLHLPLNGNANNAAVTQASQVSNDGVTAYDTGPHPGTQSAVFSNTGTTTFSIQQFFVGTHTFTLEMWVRMTEIQSGSVLVSNRGRFTSGWTLRANRTANNASFTFEWATNGAVTNTNNTLNIATTTDVTSPDAWHHVALMVSNSSHAMIYVNGQPVLSRFLSFSQLSPLTFFNSNIFAPAIIGGPNEHDSGSRFVGRIADLRLVKNRVMYPFNVPYQPFPT